MEFKNQKKKKGAESPYALNQEEMRMLSSTVKRANRERGELPPLDTSEKAEALRFAKKNKAFTISALIALVCAIAILMSAAALGIYGIVHFARTRADYTVLLQDAKAKDITRVYKYKEVVRKDVLYIDLLPIKDYLGVIVSGSETKKKFTADDSTYMVFEQGKDTAVINGASVKLGGVAEVSNTTCMIPFSFLQRAVERGFTVSFEESTHTISLRRQYYDKERTHKVELLLNETPFEEADQFIMVETERPRLKHTYPIDITPYIDYMYMENLLLINKTTEKLTAAYDTQIKNDLLNISEIPGCLVAKDNTTYYLCSAAATSLAAMMQAMAREVPEASKTCVTSAYRSYTYQNWLFGYYIQQERNKHPDATEEELEAIVSTYSARPGESEHQTGLCVDFTDPAIGGKVDESFAETPAADWLARNAHKYGFILRYPKEKEDITGYTYEAWHYRFVGVRAATEMYKNGLCLEEYLAPSET